MALVTGAARGIGRGIARSLAEAGLAMLVKNLAIEWARYGVRVVGLAPGAVATEINRKELTKSRDLFLNWIPLGRFAP